MADENGVAPETQTESEVKDDSGMVSIGDIAEAAGLESSSFFENVSEATEEVAEETPDQESEAQPELEPEPEPEPAEEEEPEVEDSTEYSAEELTEEPEPEPIAEDSDGVKKRIGKLIEARKKAEAEADELKEKIAALERQEAPTPDPVGMDRFEKIKDFKELQARENEAEHLREWLLQNPEGGDYTDQYGQEHEVDYEQARTLMVETDRDIRKNIPLAARRLEQREESRQRAYKTFPWLKDTSSAEMQEVQRVLGKNKFIKDYYERDPFGVLTMAYAIEGIKAVNSKKAAVKPKTQAVAPKAPVPSRAAPVTRKKTVDRKSLLQKADTGSLEDASSYIENILT